MCILFVSVNNNATSDGYQLIIASNRDENYTRPTKPAAPWINLPHCISGLDEEHGGTWLGLSDHGKVGALLNIAGAPKSGDEKSRGSLVTDFLTCDLGAEEYAKRVWTERHQYRQFNLVLLEKKNIGWNLRCVGIDDRELPLNQDSIHVFGNSPINKPWKKEVESKEIFANIIENFPKTSQQKPLVESLMMMLNDQKVYFPDEQLQTESNSDIVRLCTAVFVKCPQVMYGTRTNTILLIDGQGKGQYIEKTMREPIDPNNPTWDTATYDFSLRQNSHV